MCPEAERQQSSTVASMLVLPSDSWSDWQVTSTFCCQVDSVGEGACSQGGHSVCPSCTCSALTRHLQEQGAGSSRCHITVHCKLDHLRCWTIPSTGLKPKVCSCPEINRLQFLVKYQRRDLLDPDCVGRLSRGTPMLPTALSPHSVVGGRACITGGSSVPHSYILSHIAVYSYICSVSR